MQNPGRTLAEANYSIAAAYLLMMHDFVQVGFEVFGQQNSLEAPGGNAAPVEVLHPEGPSELQLCPVQQVSLADYRGVPVPCCCTAPHHTNQTWEQGG